MRGGGQSLNSLKFMWLSEQMTGRGREGEGEHHKVLGDLFLLYVKDIQY